MAQIDHQSARTRRSVMTFSSLFQDRTTFITPRRRTKAVCKMTCKFCSVVVSYRGLKAILLANSKVELYSTDQPPLNVGLIDNDYVTKSCKCSIRDHACFGCGNVIGYHVTQPCLPCLEAKNNGHFWMFYANTTEATEIIDPVPETPVTWSDIKPIAFKEFVNR